MPDDSLPFHPAWGHPSPQKSCFRTSANTYQGSFIHLLQSLGIGPKSGSFASTGRKAKSKVFLHRLRKNKKYCKGKSISDSPILSCHHPSHPFSSIISLPLLDHFWHDDCLIESAPNTEKKICPVPSRERR